MKHPTWPEGSHMASVGSDSGSIEGVGGNTQVVCRSMEGQVAHWVLCLV
jgi:hypothetical protein